MAKSRKTAPKPDAPAAPVAPPPAPEPVTLTKDIADVVAQDPTTPEPAAVVAPVETPLPWWWETPENGPIPNDPDNVRYIARKKWRQDQAEREWQATVDEAVKVAKSGA